MLVSVHAFGVVHAFAVVTRVIEEVFHVSPINGGGRSDKFAFVLLAIAVGEFLLLRTYEPTTFAIPAMIDLCKLENSNYAGITGLTCTNLK